MFLLPWALAGSSRDGSVTITFSQVPELKGRSIRFRPVPVDGGASLRWNCTADVDLPRFYLPGNCRE